MAHRIRRNMKRVILPLQDMLKMFRVTYDVDYCMMLRSAPELPDDVVVVAVDYDAQWNAWSAILFHESWEEVPECQMIPLLSEDRCFHLEAVPLTEYLERQGFRLVRDTSLSPDDFASDRG